MVTFWSLRRGSKEVWGVDVIRFHMKKGKIARQNADNKRQQKISVKKHDLVLIVVHFYQRL